MFPKLFFPSHVSFFILMTPLSSINSFYVIHEQSQTKKLKAEKILAKIVESWIPAGPSDDLETITEEERVMLRRVGLRMKSYLPLGEC